MKILIKTRKAGFSLIEVTLALGVAGFCLLAIFGLLPVGLNSNKIAVEQGDAANIATSILSDLQATPVPTASRNYTALKDSSANSIVSPRFKFAVPTPAAPDTKVDNQTITTLLKINPQILYFDRNGSPLGTVRASPGVATPPASSLDAVGAPFFRASVGFAPPTTSFVPPTTNNSADPQYNVKCATVVRLIITWPAGADKKTTWPTVSSGSFEAVMALNRN